MKQWRVRFVCNGNEVNEFTVFPLSQDDSDMEEDDGHGGDVHEDDGDEKDDGDEGDWGDDDWGLDVMTGFDDSGGVGGDMARGSNDGTHSQQMTLYLKLRPEERARFQQ
eukprot:1486057-Rhodomonas_salina.1